MAKVAIIIRSKDRLPFLARALAAAGLLRQGSDSAHYRYCVSDIPLRFNSIGERFLGRSLGDIETVPLG